MRHLVLLLTLTLGGCFVAPDSDWDPGSSESLHAELDTMFAGIDKGDFTALTDRMDADVIVYDVDGDGNPVTMHNLDAIKTYFNGLQASLKKSGLSISSHVSSANCHATKTLGYCAIEFQQTATQGGKTMGPFKYRGTLVARRIGDRWSWVHWHGSDGDPPTPAPAPATAAAPPPVAPGAAPPPAPALTVEAVDHPPTDPKAQ